ncbi:hypothetical protein [Sulfobacillus thermosulfidooxidans]|uniref:hypothetical protein n=1 Tax=Sulfobacillus thermosulfidooxidans TaxID=28034 RepID=UPI00096BCF56|nr:hypothetical protein [Sulfobacillus thermosulfidooxidans]OLZ09201.1 hypothetical protein BFX05_14440 [Sulfobacillus thermosulfidooxidans]OLZ17766.1 hypothetical protein BFX06_12425 [Sulfobacillus thermosulfidooxidans]OLZ22311.1 hypothetical protein BFX07_09380 [Sulfobacillus thermosulfidooxidans]
MTALLTWSSIIISIIAVFLGIIGAIFTWQGINMNKEANAKLLEVTTAVNKIDGVVNSLQNGALQQLLRQHDRMVNRGLGDSESHYKIESSQNLYAKNQHFTDSIDFDSNEDHAQRYKDEER